MDDDNLIVINDSLRIPRAELSFRATRSGGPGGQHVNTSSTRIELTWNIVTSPSLTDAERARLLERLANRIDTEGVLRLVAAGSRSQARNREEVTERFRLVVAAALRVPKPRRKTRPSRAARERRLQEKRHRSEIKRRRRSVDETHE